MLFKELVEIYFDKIKKLVRDSTYQTYVYNAHTYLNREIGDMSLDELSEDVLQNALNNLLFERSTRREGGLGRGTVGNLLTMLRKLMEFAFRSDYVKEFPLDLRLAVKEEPARQMTVCAEDAKTLFEGARSAGTLKSLGVILALSLGLRIGEVCGLTWDDIDFRGGTLHVRNTVKRTYREGGRTKTVVEVTGPKTRSSERVIPVPKKVMDILRKFRPAEKGKSVGIFIISGKEKPVEPREMRRYHRKLCEKLGVPAHRFHSLRHTFATECMERGNDCKVLSAILGHASVTTTMDLYVHPSMKEKRKCVESLGFLAA